jgi:hypothetical protein
VLLDPVDKAHRLAGWAGVIAGLARVGSPISRVQWIERTAPDALNRYLKEAIDPSIGLDALPLQSYLRLTHAPRGREWPTRRPAHAVNHRPTDRLTAVGAGLAVVAVAAARPAVGRTAAMKSPRRNGVTRTNAPV